MMLIFVFALWVMRLTCATNTADGLAFRIEQPQYQMETFSVAGTTLKDNWGYVDDSVLPLDHRGYVEMMKKCDLQSSEMTMHQYGKMSTVNYYADTPSFNKFKGTDMIPENKQHYVRGESFFNNLDFEGKSKVNKAYETEDIMINQCQVPENDGSTWNVQRVGPFISTGGYDWWQIGWTDAGSLEKEIKKYSEGIDVLNTILVPVDEDGNRLGHPPIHIHHIHFVAQQGVRFRNILRGLCVSSSGTSIYTIDTSIKEKNCYNSSLYFEQHGDYQCRKEDDGMDCLTVDFSDKLRRIYHALDLEGELNDVRPFNSEPIRWYYQVAVRWKPIDATKKAMSQQTIMAPGNVIQGQQLTRVLTFPTPTDAPRFLYYTGKFWASGELIRNKLHAHNLVFESSSFFYATKEDLGLTEKKYQPEYSYKPKLVTDMGFASNDEVQQEILRNLKKSQDRYDNKCGKDGNDPKHDVCKRPRPYWVCSATYDSEEYSFGSPPKEFKFDRRPKTWCDKMNFKEGESFVVIAFSRKLNEAPIAPYPDRIPETIPGHVSWHFWYHHDDWHHSYFGRIVCNQEGIFFDASFQYGLFEIGSMMSSIFAHGGIPTGFFLRILIQYSLMGSLFTLIAYAFFLTFKRKKD